MKKTLTIIFTLAYSLMFAQPDTCKNLLGALPTLQEYGKYALAQGLVCEGGFVTTYFTTGEGDTQQIFSVMLSDGKHETNDGMLDDAKAKYEIAKASSDKTALTVSRFTTGSHSLVAHDINNGIKRIYGYKVILKNRYVLDIMANSDTITNLNEFQDFIADYVAAIKEYSLPE
jgi:hypothetical protein